MKSIIYIALLLISCSNQQTIKSDTIKKSGIEGKWIITSNRAVRNPHFENLSKDGYGSFYLLLGTIWGESNGKIFNLQEDGKVETNIVDSDFITQIDLKHVIINDSIIEFSCKFPEDTIRNIMPIKYQIVGKEMTWLLDEIIEIKLQKE